MQKTTTDVGGLDFVEAVTDPYDSRISGGISDDDRAAITDRHGAAVMIDPRRVFDGRCGHGGGGREREAGEQHMGHVRLLSGPGLCWPVTLPSLGTVD